MGGVCILSGATQRKHGIITTMQNDLETHGYMHLT